MVRQGFSARVKKSYAERGRQFSLEVDLSLPPGSFTALMGPSGAGKTTLLRLLAGLEKPDAGKIEAGEMTWSGGASFVRPQDRQVGYVFQDYALFPHMTVKDNIYYGFRKGPDKSWYEQLISVFRIGNLAGDKPASLSGGQRQRVALARALAGKPPLMLLDEPMAALDFSLRNEIRSELRQIISLLNTTVVMATHDLLEAAVMADRVVWLDDGRVNREGAPAEVLKDELQKLKSQVSGF